MQRGGGNSGAAVIAVIVMAIAAINILPKYAKTHTMPRQMAAVAEGLDRPGLSDALQRVRERHTTGTQGVVGQYRRQAQAMATEPAPVVAELPPVQQQRLSSVRELLRENYPGLDLEAENIEGGSHAGTTDQIAR